MTPVRARGVARRRLLDRGLKERLHDERTLDTESAAFDCAPPSQLEWGQLAAAEAASTVDVKQVKKVNLTELLATFPVEARTPRWERTEKEKATLSAWFAKAAWFVALRRAASGVLPGFALGTCAF